MAYKGGFIGNSRRQIICKDSTFKSAYDILDVQDQYQSDATAGRNLKKSSCNVFKSVTGKKMLRIDPKCPDGKKIFASFFIFLQQAFPLTSKA